MLNEQDGAFLSWFEIAQVRKNAPAESHDRWDQFGAPMPLARAVRVALEMMGREPVSIMLVRPRAGMSRLGAREIMRLSKREDYPYQCIGAEAGEIEQSRLADIPPPQAKSNTCHPLSTRTDAHSA
jgi:hypothetical protein